MERVKSCLCALSTRSVAVSRPALAVTGRADSGLGAVAVRRSESVANLLILGEGVEDAGGEGVGGDDPAGAKAIECGLDRKLVVAHPPVGNSPGGVHGGLVLKQEEDNLLGKWVRA